MSKTKIKTERVSGFRIAIMIFTMLLLSLIMGFSTILGISLLKSSGPMKGLSDDATTVRKALPKDGTLPTQVSPLDNIGYMATVMDDQPYYHSYARNDTESSGYTQTTQSWKDYKGAEAGADGRSVMIATDLSYSALVKSSTQSCFIGGDKALIRSGGKPSSKSTTPLDVSWSEGEPDVYDKSGYKKVYGEFSTEISVYVINKDTFEKADEVVVNDDGTYTQKFYLNKLAGYWYQYGMKTRGGLKGFPEFKRIEIEFTFDKDWRILRSYCEESATISPKALGGVNMSSKSKTTTIYDYTEEGFNGSEAYNNTRGEYDFDCAAHYAYYENYFQQYKGKAPGTGSSSAAGDDILDLLGGGFGKVLSPEGEQFNIASITIGDTQYDGKIYLHIGSTGDILGSLEAKIALAKLGTNKQDLYIEFANKTVNAYYSEDFALTANIDEVADAINEISKLIKEKFDNSANTVTPVKLALADDESSEGGLLDSLLAAIEIDDKSVENAVLLKLNTDNLLNLGIGVDAVLTFSKTPAKDSEGKEYFEYDIKGINLNSVAYNSTPIDLKGEIVPSDIVTDFNRNNQQTPANLKDYIDSVYNVLNSKTIEVDFSLNDKLIEGLDLHVTANVRLASEIAANVKIEASLGDVSIILQASYERVGTYGIVYLHVTNINGIEANAKIKCNIDDTVTAVKDLISIFNKSEDGESDIQTLAAAEESSNSLANLINKVLNLNFAKIIGQVKANADEISLEIDVDQLLSGLGIDLDELLAGTDVELGLNFGKATLAISSDGVISGTLPEIGLGISVKGSTDEFVIDGSDYIDAELLVDFAADVIQEGMELAKSHDIAFTLTAENVEENISIEGSGEVVWDEEGVKAEVSLTVTSDGQNLKIDLVYDDSVADDQPIATLKLSDKSGELVTKITRNDLDEFINSFKNLIDAINGKQVDDGNGTPAPAVASYAIKVGGVSISALLASDAVQSVLSTVLNFISDFTLEVTTNEEATAICNLLVKHSSGLEISVDANGGLNLGLTKEDEFSLNASVAVGEKGRNGISEIECEEPVHFTKFVKALYDDFFNYKLDEKLLNTLFGETYAVELDLVGANSAIEALEGVDVHATLYYGTGIVGDEKGTKLLHIDLNLNIGGTAVQATVSYGGDTIYIALSKIGSTNLDGIKFSADVHNIGDAVEQLINLVTNTNLTKTISSLKGNGTSSEQETEALAGFAAVLNGDAVAKSTLTKVLEAILSLKIEISKQDSTQKIAINVDSLTEEFLGFKVGNIDAEYNIDTKKLTADVELNGKKWLHFSAGSCDKRTDVINPSDYLDISFLSTLLTDITNTVTDDDGNFNTLYTFTTGTISIDLAGVATVEFKNTKLTAGLKDGKFYLTVTADMQSSLVSNNSKVSITYSDGLIVFGRDIDSSPKFKVLTLAYLLDNLLDKNNSPVRWLLGTNETLWKLVLSFVKVDIDSGLTKPQSYRIYEENFQQIAQEGRFALSNYLSGLTVKIGDYESKYGNDGKGATLATSKFNLNGDYYALDINGKSLLGDNLSALCAAISRDKDNNALSGLAAYGEFNVIKFTINLGDLKGGEIAEAAPDYLETVINDYGFDRDNVFERTASHEKNHTNPIFGCYDTASAKYYSSDVLETISLDIYDGLGSENYWTLDVKYGSTVYLVGDFPEFTGEYKKTIYVDANGNDLGKSMVIDESNIKYVDGVGRVSIYKSNKEAVKVVFNFVDIDEVDSVSAALSYGDKLAEYPLNGYTFVGWYKESSFINQVTTVNRSDEVNGEIILYGWYMETVVGDNGVVYTFDTVEKVYYVSGKDESRISKYYYGGELADQWLIIADEVNGYPVKYIASDAFANYAFTDDNTRAGSLVKVLIPESVIAIYDRAFIDNKALSQVVVCADNVFFGGRADDKGSNSAFYGCYDKSDISGTENKNFTVYYNGLLGRNPYEGHIPTINEEIDFNGWNRIYYYKQLVGQTTYTMKTQPGGWLFADYKFKYGDGVGSDLSDYINGLNLFTSGFITDNVSGYEYTADQIKSIVLDEINKYTANNCQFINGYNVVVTVNDETTGSVVRNKYSKVIITVTEASYREHQVNLTATVDGTLDNKAVYVTDELGNQIVRGIGDNYYLADGKYFVVLNSGYEFDSENPSTDLTYDEASGKYYFEVNGGAIEISVICTQPKVETITLYSEVEFSFTSDAYTVAEGGKQATVSAEVSLLESPTATGYSFIGWAYLDGVNYVFSDGTLNKGEYYAIWADNSRDVFDSFEASGTTIKATVNGNAAGVHSWYYEEYKNGLEAVATCTDNTATFTTISKTILHARLIYSLAVNLQAGTTDWYSSVSDDGNAIDIDWTYRSSIFGQTATGVDTSNCEKLANDTFIIDIAEGYNVEVYRYWTNAIVVKIYDNNTCLKTYLIKGHKTGSYGSWRDFGQDKTHYFTFDSGDWIIDSNLTNEGSNGYYRKGNTYPDGNTQILGTIESTASNLSFTNVA